MLQIRSMFILLALLGNVSFQNSYASETVRISDDEINKILKAKEIVRSMVRNPDTLVFHELKTSVSGNTVTLTFTCKNDFGVPETHTKSITVN